MQSAAPGWGSPPAATGVREGSGDKAGGDRAGGGWRRPALCAILATLMLVVFLNMALTMWILTVLQFSVDGIGPIRIVQGGIQLSGQALVTGSLVVARVTSRVGQPLALNSYRNFTVNVRGPDGHLESQLIIKRSGVEVSARSFHVRDELGRSVFSAEEGEVRLGAGGGAALRVTGDGGVRVGGSVQAPAVRADAGQDLVLESPTRTLDMSAPQSISLESRAGGIAASTLKDITLFSAAGSVRLDAANVYLHNLTTAKRAPPPQARARPAQRIYQLCACADGKMFLAPPDGLCQAHDDEDVCR